MKTFLRRPIVILLSLLIVSLMFGATAVFAAGKLDWGSNNVLVKTIKGSPYEESSLQLKSDKQGNVFIVWTERALDRSKLYAQKYTAQGKPAWQQPIQVTQYDVALPYIGYPYQGNSLVLTDDGGIIVVWMDNRDNRQPDAYAQKINADGSMPWAKDGAPVYAGPGFQQITNVISDNNGGVEVLWVDQERPGQFMQRLGPDGKPLWQDGGISLDTITGIESKNSFFGGPYGYNPYSSIAQPDNQGGFYLTWSNFSQVYPYGLGSIETTNTYTFVQRVDSNGQKAWQQAIPIKQVQPQYESPQGFATTSDGSLVVCQFVVRPESLPKPNQSVNQPYQPIYDEFAWRISPDGHLVWDGKKPLYTTAKESYLEWPLSVASSGNGIITGMSLSQYSGNTSKMHVMGIDESGTVTWHRQISSSRSYGGPNAVQSDGKDGVFVISTLPPTKQSANKPYVLIQRLNKDGKALWEGSGVKFLTSINGSYSTRLEADGSGGVFIGWNDVRRPDPGMYEGKPEFLTLTRADINLQHIKDDGSGWPDVAANDWSYPFIDGLVKSGAIKGYDDGSFKPNGYITRAEFAKLAVITLGYDKLDVDPGEAIFDHYDYNEIGKSWAKSYILKAIKAGIMKGYYSPRKTVYADRFKSGPVPDMAFRPNARITRAEAAAIIFRAKNLQAAAVTQQFTDVPANHWAFQYVDGLRQLGIAAGYGDNEYRPMNVISRKEAAKMIFKVMPGLQQ